MRQEVTRIEEERIQVLNNIEELEQKIKDLDTQMDESVREVCNMMMYTLLDTATLLIHTGDGRLSFSLHGFMSGSLVLHLRFFSVLRMW